MRRGESPTCTSYPWQAASRGGSRTGAPRLTGLSWTPDGREIVYDGDEPLASRLWRIQANSATPARGSPIADLPAGARNPSISRPAAGHPGRLAFQTINRDVDLYLMDLDARLVNDRIESRPFCNSTRVEGSARFSPDGSRIAFVSLRSGATEIWVAGRDGSGLQQVTTLGAAGVMVGGWSPDGRGSRSRQQSPAIPTSISSEQMEGTCAG